METLTTVRRHAFLSPGYNCWSLWTGEGTSSLTNPGSTHRVLESLAYAIDKMTSDGWHLQQIFVEQSNPVLVLFYREDPATP